MSRYIDADALKKTFELLVADENDRKFINGVIEMFPTAYDVEAVREQIKKEVACLKGKYNRCRNELCLRCGRYKKSHLGACDGCVWKESDAE